MILSVSRVLIKVAKFIVKTNTRQTAISKKETVSDGVGGGGGNPKLIVSCEFVLPFLLREKGATRPTTT